MRGKAFPKVHKAALSISIITALSLFGDSLLYPVLPLYAAELKIPLVMVGVVLSANRWVRLYSNHLAAKTFDRHGIFLPILLATIGAVISTGSYAFPIGIVGLLVARMLWGVCFSYFRMGSYLVVLQTSRPILGYALGFTQAISRIGSALVVIAGGYFIDKLGYQWTMLTLALLSGLAIPLAFVLKAQLAASDYQEQELEEPISTKLTPVVRDSQMSIKFCSISALVNHLVGSGLVTSSLSLLLQQTIGTSLSFGYWTLGIATISGLVFSTNWLSAIFLSPIAGHLSDIYGRKKPFLILTMLQSIALLTLAITSSPWLSIISAILFFALTNLQKVCLDAALGDATDISNRTDVTASYNSYQDLGAAIGPLLGYGVAAIFGFREVYSLGALALFSLVVLLPLSNVLRRRNYVKEQMK